MGSPRASAIVAVAVMALGLAGLAGPAAAQVVPPRPPAAPAWLGITYETQWLQLGDECRPVVYVDGVVQGSPADRAGLRPGEVILTLDGDPMPGPRLAALARRLSVGDSVRLRLDREGRGREVTAIADRRPDRPPVLTRAAPGDPDIAPTDPIVSFRGDTLMARNLEALLRGGRGYWLASGDGRAVYRRLSRRSPNDVDRRVVTLARCVAATPWDLPAPAPRVDVREVRARADSLRVMIARRMLDQDADYGVAGMRHVAGAEVTPLEPELAEYFRNARDGLLVLRVGAGTLADRAGLRPGDVLVRADGRRLDSLADLRVVLARPETAPVQLEVVRKGRTRALTLLRR